MERDRIHFIDALRGYAILMMLQGHTVGVVLAEQWRSNEYTAYFLWNYLRGLTAPAFLFASGLVLTYLFYSRPVEQRSARIVKTVKRGVWLMCLGSLTLVYPRTIQNVLQGEWEKIHFHTITSVLHIIGLALVLSAAIFTVSKRSEKRFVCIVSLCTLGLFFGAPWLRDVQTGIGILDFWNQQRSGSIFVLSPWLGHYFSGCLFGYWATRKAWYRNMKWLVAMLSMGYLISRQFFWYLEHLLVQLRVLDYGNETFREGFDQIYRQGEVWMLVGLIAIVAHFGKAPKWLCHCGKETLSIYMIHSAIVYSAWFGIGYSTLCRRALGPWETLTLALGTVLLFIYLAKALPKWRERLPFLDWIR